jgi:hypothetical protein
VVWAGSLVGGGGYGVCGSVFGFGDLVEGDEVEVGEEG